MNIEKKVKLLEKNFEEYIYKPENWKMKYPKAGRGTYAKLSTNSWNEFAKVVVNMECDDEYDKEGMYFAKHIEICSPKFIKKLLEERKQLLERIESNENAK